MQKISPPPTHTRVRNTNLELYRIIAMLLIVAHHYVVNSGVMPQMIADGFVPRSLFTLSLACGVKSVSIVSS